MNRLSRADRAKTSRETSERTPVWLQGPTRSTMFGLFSVLLFFLFRVAAANQAHAHWDPGDPLVPTEHRDQAPWDPSDLQMSPKGYSPLETSPSQHRAGTSEYGQAAVQWQAILRDLHPEDETALLDFIAAEIATKEENAALRQQLELIRALQTPIMDTQLIPLPSPPPSQPTSSLYKINANPSTHRQLSVAVTVSTFAELSTYAATGNYIITVDSDIDFNSTITISGVSTTVTSSTSAALDGGGTYQLFYIESSATVTFSGLEFRNGYADPSGGCIYIEESDVVVQDSLFFACIAAGTAAGTGGGGGGGGIYTQDTSSYLHSLTVESTVFQDCEAPCTYSYQGGSGIHAAYWSTMNIISCEFLNGYAGWRGGHIHSQYYSKVTIQGSRFINGSASQAGCIYHTGSNSVGVLLIESSSFEFCSANTNVSGLA